MEAEIKLCPKCKQYKPLHLFRKKKDKFRTPCLECHRKECRENFHKRKSITKSIPDYKVCSKCNIKQSNHYFYLYPSSKDGLLGVCKKCAVLRYTNWRTSKKNDLVFAQQNRDRAIKSRKKRKEEIFNHYGKSCSCCGEQEIEFLEIDHINNNGSQHRKLIKTNLYSWLRKNNYPDGFQTLCCNCNKSKGKHPSHICIHKRL